MSPKTLAKEKKRRQTGPVSPAAWNMWGPYLAERQWGTVREDYSAYGDCWNYLPHDHARSRAYRWDEDGLLGICDEKCRLCFAVALWNEKDPILKERLFGLTGPEGNHGEDVKECYYYLDATPTHSYLKGLYKYPQAEYPYERLVRENAGRGKDERELELIDTGVFDENRYFDVLVEYAKASPEDILIRITVSNCGPQDARLHLLPTLWFRNLWSWGEIYEGVKQRPRLREEKSCRVHVSHESMQDYVWAFEPAENEDAQLLFTENETNTERLFGSPNGRHHVKDAFHRYLIGGEREAVSSSSEGSKAAAHYILDIPAGGMQVIRLRLAEASLMPARPFGRDFDATVDGRAREAETFYRSIVGETVSEDEFQVARQAFAGLIWTKQYYNYHVPEWLDGDPDTIPPPPERKDGRNHEWRHLNNSDVLSMPDKWEYPWFAAWDLSFHTIPFARVDPDFAKHQLDLLTREWYMHPNGQIPAYEFAFGDVNPPVHAWASWRVYKMTGPRGHRDRLFLERVFHKLLMNFTWWVNRKDPEGNNVFGGGFLGLDNIGVFDRSQPLPTGGQLQQADGTAWMAFYSGTMLSIALELAQHNPAYEDIASKFFEHFLSIADAMNHLYGDGLWQDDDGFFYDKIRVDGQIIPLRIRSLVGLIPLIAAEILEESKLDQLPGFKSRMEWFLRHDKSLLAREMCLEKNEAHGGNSHYLLAIPSRERLVRILHYMLDENEFLSNYGIRSVSKVHEEHPFRFVDWNSGNTFEVSYTPGESNTWLFGGNSNWRGPIWFPINYLLVEALERYHHYYGDSLNVEFPTGSGKMMNLKQVARELSRRLVRLFLPSRDGARPVHDGDPRYAADPAWKDLVLFYEYFHGDTGRGVGASHQTGWTALVIDLIRKMYR